MLDHARATKSAESILERSDADERCELLAVCSTMAQVVADIGTSIDTENWTSAAAHAAEVEQLARVVGCFSQLKAPPYRSVCQTCAAESTEPGNCGVCDGPTRR
jgi:cobalamin biosynthesis protein CbiD